MFKPKVYKSVPVQSYRRGSYDPAVTTDALRSVGSARLANALGISIDELGPTTLWYQEGIHSFEQDMSGSLEDALRGLMPGIDLADTFNLSALYVVAELPPRFAVGKHQKIAYLARMDGTSEVRLVHQDRGIFVFDWGHFSADTERALQINIRLAPGIKPTEVKKQAIALTEEFPKLKFYSYTNGVDRSQTSGTIVAKGIDPVSLLSVRSKMSDDSDVAVELWKTPMPPGSTRFHQAIPLDSFSSRDLIHPSRMGSLIFRLKEKGFNFVSPLTLPPPLGMGVPVLAMIGAEVSATQLPTLRHGLLEQGIETVELVELGAPPPPRKIDLSKIAPRDRKLAEGICAAMLEAFHDPVARARWGLIGTIDRDRLEQVRYIPGIVQVTEFR